MDDIYGIYDIHNAVFTKDYPYKILQKYNFIFKLCTTHYCILKVCHPEIPTAV